MKNEELLFIVFVSYFIGTIAGLLIGIESQGYKAMCEKSFAIATKTSLQTVQTSLKNKED